MVDLSFFDEATGKVDLEAFEKVMEELKKDAAGFQPGQLVRARTVRVEQRKRRPSRLIVWLVLDTHFDSQDALGDQRRVDEYDFEAHGDQRAIVVYRSTSPEHRLLFGSQPFELNDVDGTTAISPRQIDDALASTAVAASPSPFTTEAAEDESIPRATAYSLLVESVGDTFSQEVYFFMARDHSDAISLAHALGPSAPAGEGTSEVRRFLYSTAHLGPQHGLVIFEATVQDTAPGSA